MENTKRKISYGRALGSMLLVAMAYGLANFHRNSMAVLSPYLAQGLNLDQAQLGLLGSMMYYTYGLSQIPVGLIADRYGNTLVLRFCGVAMVLGTLMFALSKSFTMLLISRLVLGFGVSGFFVPGLSLIRVWFDPSKVGFFTSILVSLGNVFTILSYRPFQFALESFSVPGIYLAIGVFTLLICIGIFTIPKSSPDPDMTPPSLAKVPKAEKNFILTLSLFGLVYIGARQAFQSQWASSYYSQVFGLPLESISKILMLSTIGGILFGPVVGKLSDSRGSFETFYSLGLCTVALWLVLAFLPSWAPLVLIVVISLVFGAITTVTMSVAFTVLGDYIDPRIRTLTNGILNTFNFFGAAIFIQAIGYALAGLDLGDSPFRPIFLFFALIIFLARLVVKRAKTSLVNSKG